MLTASQFGRLVRAAIISLTGGFISLGALVVLLSSNADFDGHPALRAIAIACSALFTVALKTADIALGVRRTMSFMMIGLGVSLLASAAIVYQFTQITSAAMTLWISSGALFVAAGSFNRFILRPLLFPVDVAMLAGYQAGRTHERQLRGLRARGHNHE